MLSSVQSNGGYNWGRKNWQGFCTYGGSDVIQDKRVSEQRCGYVRKAGDTKRDNTCSIVQCSIAEKPYSLAVPFQALFSAMQISDLTCINLLLCLMLGLRAS